MYLLTDDADSLREANFYTNNSTLTTDSKRYTLNSTLNSGLKVTILVSRVEAGASLHRVEHVMTHNQSLRVLRMQLFQQLPHSGFLGFGAGVGSTAFVVQPTFVADADGVAVVILAM